jgi:antitoxin (DNA-binding transcriptional repressor) of toxin-antitoxin stability system
MKTIKLSQASRPLAEYARELNEDITLLTENGKPVAAIVPLQGVDRESLALSAHPEFLDLIARSRADFSAGRTLSLDAMRKAVVPGLKHHKRSASQGARSRSGGA